MTADMIPPSDESRWKMGKPINYTQLSTAQLKVRVREINDRLVDMGEPRPLLTGSTPRSEEARDLHSQYGAIMYACYKRGIEIKGPDNE